MTKRGPQKLTGSRTSSAEMMWRLKLGFAFSFQFYWDSNWHTALCRFKVLLLFFSRWMWLFGGLMDSGPPGSSVHRVSQARMLECIGTSFSKDWNFYISNTRSTFRGWEQKGKRNLLPLAVAEVTSQTCPQHKMKQQDPTSTRQAHSRHRPALFTRKRGISMGFASRRLSSLIDHTELMEDWSISVHVKN